MQQGRIELELLKGFSSQPSSSPALEGKRVAVLGLTGTGKSLLINRISESNLMNVVSIFPGTTELQSLVAEVNGQKIHFMDCPGIGTGVKADKKTLKLYHRVISESDCILWAIRADTNPITLDEQCIDQLSVGLLERELPLYLILTHSDRIQPGNWDGSRNKPNEEQARSLELRSIYLSGILQIPLDTSFQEKMY